MARTSWKGLYYSNHIIKCAYLIKTNGFLKGKNRAIFDKSISIPKMFLGHKIAVYQGSSYRWLRVKRYFIGCKAGEFSFTRKPFKYTKKSKASGKRR